MVRLYHYCWPPQNALYWGGLAAGRLLAVPLAARLSPATMIRADLAGAILSSAAMLLHQAARGNANHGAAAGAAAWAFTALFGLSLASVFPTVLTHAERSMRVGTFSRH